MTAAVSRLSLTTVFHCPNSRFVVMATLRRSYQMAITWNRSFAAWRCRGKKPSSWALRKGMYRPFW